MTVEVQSRRSSAAVVVTVSLAAVGLIGWLDFETGPVAMSLFYFVPIVVTAWKAGRTSSVVVSLAAGGVWLASELALMQHAEHVILWNCFTRTTTFVVIAVMVSVVRRDRERLAAALEMETRVARTDPLTGLPNSRSFREALARELARGQRENIAIGISYIDLDNFKKINDTMGHDAGDDVLRRVGEALARSLRAEDMAARLGGDEFAILSVRPTEEGLASIAKRVLAEVGEIARDYEGKGFGCTLGMILFPVAPEDAIVAVAEADALMYEVKARSKGAFEVRVSRGARALG